MVVMAKNMKSVRVETWDMCSAFSTVLRMMAPAWQKITGSKHLSSTSHGTSCWETLIGFRPTADCLLCMFAALTRPTLGRALREGRRLKGPLMFQESSNIDWKESREYVPKFYFAIVSILIRASFSAPTFMKISVSHVLARTIEANFSRCNPHRNWKCNAEVALGTSLLQAKLNLVGLGWEVRYATVAVPKHAANWP